MVALIDKEKPRGQTCIIHCAKPELVTLTPAGLCGGVTSILQDKNR